MNKNKLLILLLMLSPIISSCSGSNIEKIYINSISRNYPASNDTLDDFLIQLDLATLTNMIETKESFPLYLSSNTCSACLSAKPNIIEYVKTYNRQIFYYDVTTSVDYFALAKAYPDYNNLGTPSLYFYNKGVIKEKSVGANRLLSLSKTNNLLKGFTDVSNLTYIYNISLVNQLIESGEQILVIDKSNKEIATSFANNYYDLLINKKEKAYIYDLSFTGSESKSVNASSIGYDFSAPALYSRENGLVYNPIF